MSEEFIFHFDRSSALSGMAKRDDYELTAALAAGDNDSWTLRRINATDVTARSCRMRGQIRKGENETDGHGVPRVENVRRE